MLNGARPDLVIDHNVGAFRRIFDPHWGPRTDYVMRSVCMTLFGVLSGKSCLDKSLNMEDDHQSILEALR